MPFIDSTDRSGYLELPKEGPPAFGHPMLKLFGLKPGYVNLNSGSYGVLPIAVHNACKKLSDEAEAAPDVFLRYAYRKLQRAMRARLAAFVHADVDECVLVTNATGGVNVVLRNVEWKPGDVIVQFATTYGAVKRTAQYIQDTHPFVAISSFQIKFPATNASITEDFKAHLKSLERKEGSNVYAIIDALSSHPGTLLPWEEMVKICREENVWSVVDAAHAIGQQVDINLEKAQPDFWVANCHKWLYSKRGSALFYVPKRNQHLIRSSFPTSWGYVSPNDPAGGPKPPNFVSQFEGNGTIDEVPYLSIDYALDFRRWLGGEKLINDYCHDLAIRGGKLLAELFGTSLLDPSGELTLNMVDVELPLEGVAPSDELSKRLMESMLFDFNACTAHYYLDGKWWVRCSAQIFNEISDFEYVGQSLLSICREIRGANKS